MAGKRQKTLQQAARSKGGSRGNGSVRSSSKRPAAKGKLAKLAKLAKGRTSTSRAGLLSVQVWHKGGSRADTISETGADEDRVGSAVGVGGRCWQKRW